MISVSSFDTLINNIIELTLGMAKNYDYIVSLCDKNEGTPLIRLNLLFLVFKVSENSWEGVSSLTSRSISN